MMHFPCLRQGFADHPLAFQITEATASNATAVPTLSEWGLLLLTLTIAGGAVVGWRRGFH